MPRGRPVTDSSGNRSYEYSRPNKPNGPRAFFRLLRTTDGEELLRVDGPHHDIASSADHFAMTLASLKGSSEVVLVEAHTGMRRVLERAQVVRPPDGPLAFSPDGQTVVLVTRDGMLSRWQAPDFAQSAVTPIEIGSAEVKSIALHPQGAIFIGLSNGGMLLVDPAGKPMHEWAVAAHADVPDFEREITAPAINDDGRRLATAHGEVGSDVRIWNL